MIYRPEQAHEFKLTLEKGRSLLGLDFGNKYLGIAKSDDMWVLASPFQVILTKDTHLLKELVLKYNIGGFVVGYPLQMDGAEGENCQKVLKFVKEEIIRFDLPIYLQDERLSTKMAKRFLDQSNLRRQAKDVLDNKVAASIILESFLNTVKSL